jgi:hypothetical protein
MHFILLFFVQMCLLLCYAFDIDFVIFRFQDLGAVKKVMVIILDIVENV